MQILRHIQKLEPSIKEQQLLLPVKTSILLKVVAGSEPQTLLLQSMQILRHIQKLEQSIKEQQLLLLVKTSMHVLPQLWHGGTTTKLQLTTKETLTDQ